MRVILLRYISFSCSARLSRAPESERARLPRPKAAFLGGTGTGEPEPERGCRQSRSFAWQSRSFAGAGRRKSPDAVPRQRVEQETNRKQFRHVGRRRQVAGQRENAPQRAVAPEFVRNGGSRPASWSASTPLVASCSDGEDRRGVATQSEWRRQLGLARSDVRWECLFPGSREHGPRGDSRRTRE